MKQNDKKIFDEVHALIDELMVKKDAVKNIEKILSGRADKLQRTVTTEDVGEKLNVLIFQLATDYFALDAQYVFEVRPISDITPVPCTPDFVIGITGIRGAIYSVIDIRQTFGLDDQAVTENSMYVMLNWRQVELCLLVDAVHEKISLPKSEIKSLSVGSKESVSGILSGFFVHQSKKVSLLNWDSYLTQANIIIDEDS